MPVSFISYDGWRPGGGYFGEGWAVAQNLYSGFESAGKPWRKFTELAGSVADGPMIGSHCHTWASGIGASYTPDAQTLFTGSRTRLYTVDTSTGAFTDVSRVGGYAAAGTPAGWRYVSFGNDCYATNWLDACQRRTNNVGLFANGFTGAFLPVPRFLATIREHLVAANLNNVGRFQDEVAWSDADNGTDFNPPTGTSTSIAGSKRLNSIPGQITGLLGGQYGLAWKRTGIYYLEATGTAQVLRPDILSDSIGTAFPSSIIRTRHGVFFLGPDGFYRISGLSAPVKISPPGVDAALLPFLSLVTSGIAAYEEDTQAEAFAFAGLHLIGWAYRDAMSGIGSSKVVLYDPIREAWGYGLISPSGSGAFVGRPAGVDLYDSAGCFSWDSTNSRFARYSTGLSVNHYQQIELELRFRPANFETVAHQAQSVVKGILPMFAKTGAFASDAVEPTINLDAALEPFQTGFTTEGPRTYAQRDPTSGFYPFEKAGRFFRVRISLAPAMFENFLGIWIDQEILR